MSALSMGVKTGDEAYRVKGGSNNCDATRQRRQLIAFLKNTRLVREHFHSRPFFSL